MLRHVLQSRITLGAAFTIYFASHVILSAQVGPPSPTIPPGELPAPDGAPVAAQASAAPADSPAQDTAQSYVGTNQCVVCHRPQANAWAETNHAQAFTHLPEAYQNDVTCLRCHVTGFGEPRGYVAGSSTDLLMVGCESCHGPGALHVAAVQRFIMSSTEDPNLEKEIRDTVTKTPPNSVCVACHKTQAHQRHPAYDGGTTPQASSGSVVQCIPALPHMQCANSATAAVRYASGYNIKTCGSCHYDEYRQWRAEKHAALSAMLPSMHRNDPSCQKCHPLPDVATEGSTAVSPSHSTGIGVTCESCHGPAREHVRFSVQFISSPPLGPELEQAARQSIRKGTPATACIQCHVQQSHLQHPQFDK